MSGSSPKPFPSPASPRHCLTPTEADQPRQESSFRSEHQEPAFMPRKPRDSGIEESYQEPLPQQQQPPPRIKYHVINEAAEKNSDVCSGDTPSPVSSGSNSSNGFLSSIGPVSHHDSSVYSSDNTVEGGGEEGGEGGGGAGSKASHYVLPVSEKGKRGKGSSKHTVEEVTENSFTLHTPSYSYKWFTGLPNKLNNRKNLKAREMTVWKNKQKKSSTKLRSEVEILPNITEPSNERVVKMGIRLAVENARLEEYECVAIVRVSLHHPHTEDAILQQQERRTFARGFNDVQFFTTLGSQETVERCANKLLDLTFRVELQFQYIC